MDVDKDQNKKRALLEALRLTGKPKQLAKKIGASRSQVNNWLNRGDTVPYEYAVIMTDLTGINIERFAPKQSLANQIIQQWRQHAPPTRTTVAIKNITISALTWAHLRLSQTPQTADTDAPILLSTQLTVIDGLDRLLNRQHQGHHSVPAILIDLDQFLNGSCALEPRDPPWRLSERAAIALALEARWSDRQEQCEEAQHDTMKPKQVEQSEAIAAKLTGFSSRDTYCHVKYVLQYGMPELIEAMDAQRITPSRAAAQLHDTVDQGSESTRGAASHRQPITH